MGRLSEYDEEGRKVIAPEAPAPEARVRQFLLDHPTGLYQPGAAIGQEVGLPLEESRAICDRLVQSGFARFEVGQFGRIYGLAENRVAPPQTPAPESESNGLEFEWLDEDGGTGSLAGARDAFFHSQAEAEIARLEARVAELEAEVDEYREAMSLDDGHVAVIEADLAELRPVARAGERLCDANSRMSNDPAAFEEHEEAFCDLVEALDALPAPTRERLLKEES